MPILKLVLLASSFHLLAGIKHRSAFLGRSHFDRESSSSLLKLHPYYHSTDGIHEDLLALSSRCSAMTLDTRSAGSQSIDVVTIKAPGSSPTNKIFMIFGEHARELISPESGLHFIKSLCGETEDKDRAAKVLQESEFQVIVDANPESRKMVEQGDTCLRANPNGVDLNRNWDEKWQSPQDGVNAFAFVSQTDPGPKPFSEPETRLFKELVSKYKPTTFVSVHSGTKGMYMPWAYTAQLAERNQAAMMKVLKALDKDHCECPFGANGKEVGYTGGGTSLDWVYDKLQTQYAFTFEIYGDPDMDESLKNVWKKKMQRREAFFQSSEVSRRMQSHQVDVENFGHSMSEDGCFFMYNPDSAKRYNDTIHNWSAAYLQMAEMISKNMKKDQL